MDRQELVALGTRLKQIISETTPAQNVTATAGFCVDSDTVALSLYISSSGSCHTAKAEAKYGQAD